ncbi:protein of unknown function [Actinopolymorpha cephalotaxi]|uniref:DUF1707 domain-containing protein n=1 Tax=Actinopolymorpha cephalotaxi TaxID=504797 RepID=A0A1I2WS99_9ACTN|nr:DUF1707 domain-containing protein [Actinopolymorpha cephalotaxi]NYH85065.1 hypothetical protein [Actinopolymorpha cephalotaxi]SFH03216.1 protein of unknown function [Actinopolymorpha cephalotaxi]
MSVDNARSIGSRRIGDEERHICADLLADHHAHGRLTQEEFEERLGVALTAPTARELGRVLADLPTSAPDRPLPTSTSVEPAPSPEPLAWSLLLMGGTALVVYLLSVMICMTIPGFGMDAAATLAVVPSLLGVVGGFLVAKGLPTRPKSD